MIEDWDQFPGGEEIAPGIRAADGAIRFQYSRGSGPGGQNVNKVNTRAELWLGITKIVGLSHAALNRLRTLAASRLTVADELHLVSEIHRSQEANRKEVLDRLRQLVQQARVEPKPRRKTRPTAASRRRRLDSKRHRSEIKARRGGKE
jgi:ribosome-associated protein